MRMAHANIFASTVFFGSALEILFGALNSNKQA